VNRHLDQAIETDIISQLGEFARNGAAFEVNGENVNIRNSKDELNVETVEKKFSAGGEQFSYTFPAHSYTMLKIKISQ